mgnify:CR=1 FL=1
MMNVKKLVVYYSFVFYCMVMFSFIACIILLCKAFGGVIFEVQTYINSKREVEVSPRGTRIFSKWFAGILGILFYLYSGWVLYAGYSLHSQNFIRSIYWNTRGGIVKPSGRNCIYLDSSRMFLICTYWKKIVTCPDPKGADKKKAYRNLFIGEENIGFYFWYRH